MGGARSGPGHPPAGLAQALGHSEKGHAKVTRASLASRAPTRHGQDAKPCPLWEKKSSDFLRSANEAHLASGPGMGCLLPGCSWLVKPWYRASFLHVFLFKLIKPKECLCPGTDATCMPLAACGFQSLVGQKAKPREGQKHPQDIRNTPWIPNVQSTCRSSANFQNFSVTLGPLQSFHMVPQEPPELQKPHRTGVTLQDLSNTHGMLSHWR